MTDVEENYEGGCTCGHVRYKMHSSPLVVHGCHCTWCQRQSGGSFAVNALIEADRVEVTKGDVNEVLVDSPSGTGQKKLPDARNAKLLSGAIIWYLAARSVSMFVSFALGRSTTQSNYHLTCISSRKPSTLGSFCHQMCLLLTFITTRTRHGAPRALNAWTHLKHLWMDWQPSSLRGMSRRLSNRPTPNWKCRAQPW